ncbi:MAG TPA: hypothetical protein VGP63_09655 [Planctomycetaceae bacterium]|jgi:hypothetical protein|nr:hypothetical protein [Planctomycetaceae bacterium]
MAADEVLLIADYDDCHFEIQEGRGEGFYIFRFVGENTVPSHDHLQDDLASAKSCALCEWGVPESAWKPRDSSEDSRLRSTQNQPPHSIELSGIVRFVRKLMRRGPSQ